MSISRGNKCRVGDKALAKFSLKRIVILLYIDCVPFFGCCGLVLEFVLDVVLELVLERVLELVLVAGTL